MASSPLASLRPEEAAALPCVPASARVAGSQAEALVARRGFGEARALWPDARRLPLLSPAHLGDHLSPIYGRAPDARLPGGLLPQPA
jgi:hypothetical protein